MHYEELDDLEPYFRDSIKEYLKLCYIDFENPGEAVVTTTVDGVSEDSLKSTCFPLIKSSIEKLFSECPDRKEEFLDTLIADIFLVGGPSLKMKVVGIAACLSASDLGLWKRLVNEKGKMWGGFYDSLGLKPMNDV